MRILRGNSNRYQVRLLAVALLAVLGLVAAGCGGMSASSAQKSGVAGAQHSTSSVAVVTYDRWPLYTFLEDKAARQAKGWNANLNGGKWYVISASGKVVKHKTSSGGGSG